MATPCFGQFLIFFKNYLQLSISCGWCFTNLNTAFIPRWESDRFRFFFSVSCLCVCFIKSENYGCQREKIRVGIRLVGRQNEFPSDHYLVDFFIRLKFKRSKRVPRKTYDYKGADFDDLRSRLQLLPSDMSHSDDVDIYWSQWKDLFLATVAECVPMKTIRDTNSPPWIDREVKFALRRKYRALRKYRENKTVERKLKLRTLSNEIKKLVRQKHRDYLLKIEGSLKENPKLFWNYHKVILHHRSGSNTEITFDGKSAKTAAEKAELFNAYFCSVFTSSKQDKARSLQMYPMRMNMEISEITLSLNEVRHCLSILDRQKPLARWNSCGYS